MAGAKSGGERVQRAPQCAPVLPQRATHPPAAARWKRLHRCRANPQGAGREAFPSTRALAGRHNGGPASSGRCPAPSARALQAHVASGSPALPTNLKTAQISDRQRVGCARPAGSAPGSELHEMHKIWGLPKWAPPRTATS